MNFLTEEQKAEEVKKRIEGYRSAAQYYITIKSVLEKFDGKVFNCKLEKALQEATGLHIYANKRYRNLEIYFYNSQCSNRTMSFVGLDLDTALTDGKRINAKAIIDDLLRNCQDFQKRAYRLEMQMKQVDAVRERVKQLESALHALTSPLDYELKEIYSLNYTLRNY